MSSTFRAVDMNARSSVLHDTWVEKPYLVLLEPATGWAAAYDADNRLITERASDALVAFALDRHVHAEPWDELKDLAIERQLPDWATGPLLRGCMLYWLRNGWTKFRDLLDTPSA